MRMRYEVTGLVPARIEVRPGIHPGIRHPDLKCVEVSLYIKDSEPESGIRAGYPPLAGVVVVAGDPPVSGG